MPVFPLNAVLFPGAVQPLYIFEERYRQMVKELAAIAEPADRVFVVVAIREGFEVAAAGTHHTQQEVFRVGTLVQMTALESFDDGTFNIEVTGRQRVELTHLDDSAVYLRAQLHTPSTPTPSASQLGAELERTWKLFDRYHSKLAVLIENSAPPPERLRDPDLLAFSLASSCLLTLRQQQDLLEVADQIARLELLRAILLQELTVMEALPSLPAVNIARNRWSPN